MLPPHLNLSHRMYLGLSQDQIQSVLEGFLSKEKHVRLSCLQTLQVTPAVKSATLGAVPFTVSRCVLLCFPDAHPHRPEPCLPGCGSLSLMRTKKMPSLASCFGLKQG